MSLIYAGILWIVIGVSIGLVCFTVGIKKELDKKLENNTGYELSIATLKQEQPGSLNYNGKPIDKIHFVRAIAPDEENVIYDDNKDNIDYPLDKKIENKEDLGINLPEGTIEPNYYNGKPQGVSVKVNLHPEKKKIVNNKKEKK